MSSMSSSPLSAPAAALRRPPRALTLVRDPRPEEIGATIDWSAWHLEQEDDVGQSFEQDKVVQTVCSSLRVRLAELGRAETWVGVDVFFAWVAEAPLVRVSPDVFTLPGPAPDPLPRMAQTWLPGQLPPVFALEVVSDDWKKDYEDAPAKYALLGVEELVIFDADAARGDARLPRVPLQVFRRDRDGAFVRVYRGPGPARAETIDAWLVARPTKDPTRMLRLARDAGGQDEIPTEGEGMEAQARRADDEKQRADDEKQRADDEKQRADDEKQRAEEANRRADDEKRLAGEANRRAEALEAELARLRRDPAGQGD